MSAYYRGGTSVNVGVFRCGYWKAEHLNAILADLRTVLVFLDLAGDLGIRTI